MPGTFPNAAEFPSSLHPILHPLSASASTPRIDNVILFLPGLGDTSLNFSSFPRALNLPASLTITLHPPMPIPIPDAGTHWSDDLILDSTTGTIDPDSPSFYTSTKLLAEDVIRGILIEKHGFEPREIMLFGYGQGGTVVLATALQSTLSGIELGGVVAIGGVLPLAHVLVNRPKSHTPVFLLGGSKGVLARDSASGVKRTKGSFGFVECHQWRKADDGMPKTRDEALPMMAFFARRLRSRQGIPEGAVEIR